MAVRCVREVFCLCCSSLAGGRCRWSPNSTSTDGEFVCPSLAWFGLQDCGHINENSVHLLTKLITISIGNKSSPILFLILAPQTKSSRAT